jgi:hypothetical protein
VPPDLVPWCVPDLSGSEAAYLAQAITARQAGPAGDFLDRFETATAQLADGKDQRAVMPSCLSFSRANCHQAMHSFCVHRHVFYCAGTPGCFSTCQWFSTHFFAPDEEVRTPPDIPYAGGVTMRYPRKTLPPFLANRLLGGLFGVRGSGNASHGESLSLCMSEEPQPRIKIP